MHPPPTSIHWPSFSRAPSLCLIPEESFPSHGSTTTTSHANLHSTQRLAFGEQLSGDSGDAIEITNAKTFTSTVSGRVDSSLPKISTKTHTPLSSLRCQAHPSILSFGIDIQLPTLVTAAVDRPLFHSLLLRLFILLFLFDFAPPLATGLPCPSLQNSCGRAFLPPQPRLRKHGADTVT